MSLKNDIEKGLWDELSESAQKKAEKYLNTSRLGRGGKLKVTINEDAYAQARKDYGYFAFVSNKAEDCFEALRKYRLREKIEEAFKDTKNRLDGTRTRVWDGDTLKGRMFCQFIGLGYQCFLHTKIKELKEKLELSLSDKKLAEKDKNQNNRSRFVSPLLCVTVPTSLFRLVNSMQSNQSIKLCIDCFFSHLSRSAF